MIYFIYLLKVACLQFVLYACYQYWLAREAPGQWKRVYLLGALGLSFVLPIVPVRTVTTFLATVEIDPATLLVQLPAAAENINPQSGLPDPYIYWIYLLIGGGWLLGFCWRILPFIKFIQLHHKKIRQASITYRGAYRIAALPYSTAPHTFSRTVFISGLDTTDDSILQHEIAHARQRHSVDRTVIYLLKAVCWFFPQLNWYERALVLVHETLADRAVLRSGVPIPDYQHLLLATLSRSSSPTVLVSGFDFSITKKRFQMMYQLTPNRFRLAGKIGLVLVLLIGLTAAGGRTIYAQTAPPPPTPPNPAAAAPIPPPPPPIPAEFVGVVDEMGKRLQVRHPSDEQLTKWLDEKSYGVWIDGKKAERSDLLVLTPEDIAFYLESKLARNAVNFGKYDYQVDLYTTEYLPVLQTMFAPPPPPAPPAPPKKGSGQ